ncbi:hypothetical protein bcere0018_33630 [Bacillus cereus Rock1-15]|uniref:protein-export chaperone SecB n=1 Tax=Bacillus cereus TaxID=1396 RepID=UPI0001A07C95|nr:protein-export chaperone SecB [Bacillus cereus]EEL27567.1 hypothetical protein bcere0018_33630 [Bacillus cereus Rock1-15]
MNRESYEFFIEAVDFKKVEVVSLESRQNENFQPEGKMLDVYLDHKIKDEVVMDGVEMEVKVEFNAFAHKCQDELPNSPGKISDEDKLFEVKFVLKLLYYLNLEDNKKLLIEISNDQEIIDTFVNKNVPINVWPYAREIISNITMKMGFPPLMIPPYKSPVYYGE